jgi:hypothetical protein
MAKANLRKPEIDAWRARVGGAIKRAMGLREWNLDELANAVERDSRQVARWIDGIERPQFDALFAVESFRQPMVIALAELAGTGVEIETVVRITRRTA